jgi:hypothetical protein
LDHNAEYLEQRAVPSALKADAVPSKAQLERFSERNSVVG